jgi:acyl-CoA synthetase (AMP-forming)/AMP-acid ligase II
MTRIEKGNYSLRWDQFRSDAAYATGYWVTETLADAMANAQQDRILIVDGNVRLNAADLRSKSERLAQVLLGRMEPGSVVSFMLPNWHEAAIVYMGATLAGMVANPILPSLRDHDLRFILADADSRILFIPASFRGFDYAAMLARVALDLPKPPEVVLVRGGGLEAMLENVQERPLPALDADAVRMIMYTSGTTGRPKAVLHTHNSIHALIRQMGEHWHIVQGDRFLVPSPVSHIGGSIYAFECPLLLGTTAVLMDVWSAAHALPLMRAEKITHMAGATPFLQQLLTAARAAGTRLPDLKVFICGGASVPPSLIDEANDYFEKAMVSRVYGSTEVPVTTVGALGDTVHAATTDGRAGVAQIKLGAGNEICARGPQMLLGYLHAEDEKAAFDADGFYRSGDQGAWVDDYYLTVTGRIKDLIIRNGENIAPKEIEDLLVGHPAIAEIAIVGLPDPDTGERACAVIVPRDGETVVVADLADALSIHGVAKFKYPERVELRSALPKNEAGKVLKHVLRAELSAEHRSSA